MAFLPTVGEAGVKAAEPPRGTSATAPKAVAARLMRCLSMPHLLTSFADARDYPQSGAMLGHCREGAADGFLSPQRAEMLPSR
jgi:hypothetical protein